MQHRTSYATPILTALALVSLAAAARAEIELPQLSPPASVSQRIGLTDIEVKYSSPGVKDRVIWGGLVPYGEPWRTGANAATTVTFGKDVTVGGKDVPAGTYAVLTIPGKERWTFILNTDTKLSGTRNYDPKLDHLRLELAPSEIPHRERMTFLFDNFDDTKGELVLEWEKLRLAVPIAVDTAAQAAANIDATVQQAARDQANAARYLLDLGENPTRALALAETAAAMSNDWFNNFVLARALAANERWADAVDAAQVAWDQGQKAEYFFWKDQVQASLEEWKRKLD